MKRERKRGQVDPKLTLVVIATFTFLYVMIFPVLSNSQKKARLRAGLDPNTGQPATTLMLQSELVGYAPSQREGYKLSVQKLKIDEGWIYILRDVSNTGWTGDDYAAVFVPDNQE